MGERIKKDTTIQVEKTAEAVKPVIKTGLKAPVEEKTTKGVDKKVKLKYNKERRYKPTSARRGKFDIPEELKDPNFSYYWAINSGSEIEKLKAKDWFVVKNAELNKEITGESGDIVKLFGSIDLIEKETNHILMAKPKEWHEEDKAFEQAEIDKLDDAIYNDGDKKIEGGYGKVKK